MSACWAATRFPFKIGSAEDSDLLVESAPQRSLRDPPKGSKVFLMPGESGRSIRLNGAVFPCGELPRGKDQTLCAGDACLALRATGQAAKGLASLSHEAWFFSETPEAVASGTHDMTALVTLIESRRECDLRSIPSG